MSYVDYAFYKDSFLGRRISESDWDPFAKDASAYIDLITLGRLKNRPDLVSDNVKMAVCAAADVFSYYDQLSSSRPSGVASESVGSQSISYEGTADTQKNKKRELRDAVSLYLPPENPLRYAGICP
mgnify:CR=1 FL=1